MSYKNPDHGITDRKDVTGKVDPFHIPFEAIKAYAAVSDYGFIKYGNRETWKNNNSEVGVRKYLAAAMRHAYAGVDGEIDPESGLPHVYAVLWNAAAAVWHWEKDNAI